MRASLQLFTASSGRLSAKVVFENNALRHLHSTVRPEAEADLYDSMEWYGDIIVFAGIGLGWHVRRALPTIPPHARCVVIDYFDDCIRHSSETLFKDMGPDRLFFASAGAFLKTKVALSAFLNGAPAGIIQIVRHPASYDCFRNFYDPLLTIIAQHASQHPRQSGTPVKRAMLFHGNFFLEEEVRRGLMACNIEPILFTYAGKGQDVESALSKTIQKEKPDVILSINMKGFDGDGETGRTASRFGVPIVVWFVDDPRPILLSNRAHLGPRMTAFCWERHYCRELLAGGFDKAEYLPLACDPTMFASASAALPAVRLGFVGSSMVDRYAGNIKDKFLWSDGLAQLVDTVSDGLCRDPFFPVYGFLPEHARTIGVSLPFSDERNLTWLAAYIVHHASMKKRRAVVNALLPQGLETFGDMDGWNELFGTRITAHPDVQYRRELASVYRRIEININSTSCQMPTAVNQRVFDVPMAGSFVISDRQRDLFELFDANEIATYDSAEDLQEKARFYSARETERRQITGFAQRRILGEHTYAHRVKKIISFL